MQCACHDSLAAKGSLKGKGNAVKPQAGLRKASDTRGVDNTTGHGGGAPPAYVELSSHFVSLESAGKACGNGDGSFYLQRARMSFTKAHGSKLVRQADMRQFCEPQQGQGGGTAEDCSAVQ